MDSKKIINLIKEQTNQTEHLQIAIEELIGLVKGIETGLTEVRALQIARATKND